MLHPHSGAFAVHYAGTATAAGSDTHKRISEIAEYKAIRKQEEKHRQYAIPQVPSLIVAGQKFSTRQDKSIFKKSHKLKFWLYVIVKSDGKRADRISGVR